ncbi:FAD-dependent oxidoreductase [Nibrella saemangeumensis]|uniref:FAD-dependent oxidoreductase n=1 Tax=Nibrella saemangeumensis TaxID=1084526 RepID=A0ABP8MN52_9BACT
MNVRSSDTYWVSSDPVQTYYPPLQEPVDCDVLIIGGGITGALVAYELVEAGIRTVLIDKRGIAQGSTAASTALIQYEMDVPLHQLIDQIGEEDAVLSYKLCLRALDRLTGIAKKLNFAGKFHRRESLYFAAQQKDVDELKQECETRSRYDFPVSWLDKPALLRQFGLAAEGGILSSVGAELDPFAFTQALLHYLTEQGLRVFAHTAAAELTYRKQNVEVQTGQGLIITAKKVVYATGYEVPERLVEVNDITMLSTYALVTEPIPHLPERVKNAVLWDTADPYFYARTVGGNRLLIGGGDEDLLEAGQRDALIPQKQQQLLDRFSELFPDLPATAELTWAGTFAETKDGLPYIGEHPRYPHSYYALGFGGNGITFSTIAATVIRNLYQNGHCDYARLFRFGR